jgi:natural product precursor
MKKLKFKLDDEKLLSKSQMKKISGGYTDCMWTCKDAYTGDQVDFYGSYCPTDDRCGDLGNYGDYRVISCGCSYS